MSKMKWLGPVHWGRPLEGTTVARSQSAVGDTLTLDKLLDVMDRGDADERANPLPTMTKASSATIALLCSYLPPDHFTDALRCSSIRHFEGLLLHEDASVPFKEVRFYDRRGKLIRTEVIG